MFIESMNFGAEPYPNCHCIIRQPGLTHRSTCPSIPGFGAGGTPPKNDAPWIGFVCVPPAISSDLQNNDPIQEGLYLYDVLLDYPHIPRLPHVIVGGVYGVKNRCILFWLVGEVPFPSHASMCLIPMLWIGVAIIPPSFCRPAFPHNPRVVWFIYNYFCMVVYKYWRS